VRDDHVWFDDLVPTRFIDIEMPDEFVLEWLTPDGDWIDWVKGVKTRIRLVRGLHLQRDRINAPYAPATASS